MSHKHVNELINYRTEVAICSVLAVDDGRANGTPSSVSLAYRGNPAAVTVSYPASLAKPVQVGDSMVVHFSGQDRNSAQIVGRSYSQAGLMSTTEVSA